MKVLVCVPHFYNRSRFYNSAVLGSSVETLQGALRRCAIACGGCRRCCRQQIQPHDIPGQQRRLRYGGSNTEHRHRRHLPCCSREDHFLDELTSGALLKAIHNDGDPRLLGYACRRVFARNIDRYDLYCFIEDDHAILDPEFFEKVAYFYKRFGEDKFILPSRFELAGLREVAWKTYIDDGAFARMRVEPPASAEP